MSEIKLGGSLQQSLILKAVRRNFK